MKTNLLEPRSEPADRWAIVARPSTIHGRVELLDDLEHAVRPRSAPTVLVLFGFAGLAPLLEELEPPDSNAVMARIARRLRKAVDGVPSVGLYETRLGEFWGLFGGRVELIERLLPRLGASLDRRVQELGARAVTGMVVLPDEALTPIAALELADRRCRGAVGDLRVNARTRASL